MFNFFLSATQFGGLKRCQYAFSSLLSGQAHKLRGDVNHRTVRIDDLNSVQIVTLSHLKVVWIVCRSNFHRSCSVVHIDILVGDNRNLFVENRQQNASTDQVLVSFIVRVDRNCDIAENRFRARCRDNNFPNAIEGWVGNFPQFTFFGLVDNLNIRKARLVLRTKINDAFAPVN